jgi:hypothetical protein
LLARKTGIYNGLELRPKIPAKLNRNDEKSTEDEQYISHPRAALEAREEVSPARQGWEGLEVRRRAP